MAELVYPPVIAAARAVFAAYGLKFTYRGTEHVPRTGGAVMAINHTGYLDFTFAGSAAVPAKRLVRFMAKDEIFRHPVAGPLMRGMKHIPVDREAGAASLVSAVRALRDGEIVGVFPEATMSPSLELLPFKQGTVRMAVEAAVPILPTVIWGSQRVMTYGHRKKITQRPLPITVMVGEPLLLTAEDGIAGGTRRLREQMTAMLHEAQETYPDKPSGRDDSWWLPARLGGTAVTPEEGQAMVNARRKKAAADEAHETT
ncbi:MAG: lysophospholipid acyltransferase family protein [Actinomycetes bacterium]